MPAWLVVDLACLFCAVWGVSIISVGLIRYHVSRGDASPQKLAQTIADLPTYAKVLLYLFLEFDPLQTVMRFKERKASLYEADIVIPVFVVAFPYFVIVFSFAYNLSVYEYDPLPFELAMLCFVPFFFIMMKRIAYRFNT